MAEKIVLATHNAGKIREFKCILEPLGYEAVSVHDVLPSITEPEETGTTFAENALLKASYYMKVTGLPCLADDSGIAADALGGRPGVYSARYAGPDCDDEANNEKLIAELLRFRRKNGRSIIFVRWSSSGPMAVPYRLKAVVTASFRMSMSAITALATTLYSMCLKKGRPWPNCLWTKRMKSVIAGKP